MGIEDVYGRNASDLSKHEGTDKLGIRGKAIFLNDDQNKKRFFLEKRWSNGNKILVAFMMNPSKANESKGDDTVDQIIRQAKNKYDALYVVNMSPKVEGDSGELRMPDFEYDNLNWEFIKAASDEADAIFIGWGMFGQKGLKKQLKQQNLLYNYFETYKPKFVCYEIIKSTSKNKYDPEYYVPHPRPRGHKNKYVNQKFIPLNDEFFNAISK